MTSLDPRDRLFAKRADTVAEQDASAHQTADRDSVDVADGADTSVAVSYSRWDDIRAYIVLTKPRIIELLLVTTVPVLFLASGGFPPLGIALATLIGGALAAAGANTLNSYLDRDIDAVMARTERRPLVTGRIPARNALIFGTVLSILAVVV